nr:hypothetical protein [Tanacetum cinerariifolium]
PPVTTEPLPTVTPFDTPQLRQYTRRARIAQSLALPTAADEPPSPLRDGSKGQHTEMVYKIEAQELEITNLKDMVKVLEDKKGGGIAQSRDDAPIKGRSLDEGEEAVKKAVMTQQRCLPPTQEEKEKKMVESDTPKKKKLQERIDVQVARELEEEMARDAQRMNEQIVRDAEIARIHTEEELQMMIDGLDRNNKTEEEERFKRKGLRLEQDSTKKVKTTEEVPEEKLKEMMELIPVEEVYVEALQVKHLIIDWEVHTEGERSYWKIIRLGGSTSSYQFFVDLLKHFDREDLNQLLALVKETLNIRPAASDKEMELWVELKRLYEPDVEDLLWTHTQNLMHAPVEWKLYDTCRVHHVISKDQEIFMLMEKDYPLRKGLAIVMISYKLQKLDCKWSIKFRGGLLGINSQGIPTASEEFPLAE